MTERKIQAVPISSGDMKIKQNGKSMTVKISMKKKNEIEYQKYQNNIANNIYTQYYSSN